MSSTTAETPEVLDAAPVTETPVTEVAETEAENQKAAAESILAARVSKREGPARETIKKPEELETEVKAPAARRAPRARTRAPATPKPSASMKKIMGSTESFRFYKIDKLGKEALIGDYTARDLENANNDIELFIQTYLVADYGDGAYKVRGYNERGAEVSANVFSVLAPKGQIPSAAAVATGINPFEQRLITDANEKYEKLQAQLRDAERKEAARMQEQNEKLMAEMTMLQKGGNDMMGMMFMMMMRNQNQGPSPELAMLREELRESRAKLEKLSMQPPPPPPPPAQPQRDPMAEFMQFITLMDRLRPQQQQDPELMLLREKIRSLESGNKQNTFEMVFDQMNRFDEMASRRYGNSSSPAAEAVAGFFENFAVNMHALKEVIQAGGGPQQLTDGGVQEQKQPEQDVLPEGFVDLVKTLDDKEEDSERIEVVLQCLKIFHDVGSSKYKGIAKQMFGLAKEGKKDKVMPMLRMILSECVERQWIVKSSSDATYKAFDRNFTHVQEFLGGTPAETTKPPASRAPVETQPSSVIDNQQSLPETPKPPEVTATSRS